MNTAKIKPFLISILLLLLAIGGICYFGPQIVSNVQTYIATKDEIKTKTETLQKKQAKLDEYKRKEAEQKAKEEEMSKTQKPFFKPIETGMDTEAVIAGEFAEILKLIRANQIKVRAIKYD